VCSHPTSLDEGRQPRARSPGATPGARPSFAEVCRQIAAAEQRDGWLAACEAAGCFLVPCRELIDALAELLGRLLGESREPVLEVCAGSGELAAALRQSGVPVQATDAEFVVPPSGGGSRLKPELQTGSGDVLRMPAEEALEKFRSRVVLGVFVPFDAGVDEAVLRFPTVRHYVVLGARLGGLFGSPALWRHPQWSAHPLDDVARWILTRHDVWFGPAEPCVLRHGEAWHFVVES